MRVVMITDTWHPQVNGVVRSLEGLAAAARDLGASIRFITPEGFRTVPLLLFPEVRLAIATTSSVGRLITESHFDHIHLATEGPLGFAARRYCINNKIPFTTCYHTKFPEYAWARAWIPKSLIYAVLRRFHNAGRGIFVATDSLQTELERRGFDRVMHWSRGVDHGRFRLRQDSILDVARPIFLYVGRLAIEKNLDAFLRLDLPGTKVVVGDGPARASLEAAYPEARFMGMRFGETLAQVYSSADVFVFPSLSDTFGLVILEAMASGLPVAAFPVPGPLDLVGTSGAGVLDHDLKRACLKALDIPRWKPRLHAESFSWQESARQFLRNLSSAEALPYEGAAMVRSPDAGRS